MKLGATLYIKNSVEAVEFYKKAFGLTLGYNEKNPDGTFLHAALLKDGEEIFAMSESVNDRFIEMMLKSDLKQSRPTMSYSLNFNNEEEVKQAYALLIEGGTILFPLGKLPWSDCAAEVVDQFGVYWYISV